MNKIANPFLLSGDKFMPEMYLRKPVFKHSASGPFAKKEEKIEETGGLCYVYRKELDKASFQHDMAYRDFKDLKRRTAEDKVLRDKAFNIGKYPK